MGGMRRDNECWLGMGVSAEKALGLIIKQEAPYACSVPFISPSLPMLTVSYFLCKQKELWFLLTHSDIKMLLMSVLPGFCSTISPLR